MTERHALLIVYNGRLPAVLPKLPHTEYGFIQVSLAMTDREPLSVDLDAESTQENRSSNPLRHVLVFLAVIWGIFVADALVPMVDLSKWLGLEPRAWRGLLGIVGMPFVHGSLRHLIGNTIPLAVLLSLLAASQSAPWMVAGSIVVLNGVLLWCVGRSALHVGASGLVFGLMAYLIVAGFRARRIRTAIVAVIVGVLYGTSLLWGILPLHTGISWDGHLTGAIAGALLAWRNELD